METTRPVMWSLSKYDLEKLLRDYDEENGQYPEHSYEGFAVWRFIIKTIEGREFPFGTTSFSDQNEKPTPLPETNN